MPVSVSVRERENVVVVCTPDTHREQGCACTSRQVATGDNHTHTRRAGDPQGNNLYTSHVPLGPPTKLWSDTAVANPTVLPEYLQRINVYSPNCGFIGCPYPGFTGRVCDNDTISQGLFYADQYPPMRITASRNPDDLENLAPWVGPRCLTHYRACDDDCDYELGVSQTVQELNEAAGTMQKAQRRGFVYAQPWGVPLQSADDPTGKHASQS